MTRIHFPYFDAEWGSMAILQSLTDFLIMDTFGIGQTHARKYVMDLLGDNNASMLFTHPHKDHNKDCEYYIKKGKIKTLYISNVPAKQEASSDKTRLNEYVNLVKKHGGKVVYLKTGDVITVGAAKVKVLLAPNLGGNNANSLCLKITAGKVSGLILGDATEDTLKELVSVAGDELKDITWWRTNHHCVPENNPLWWIQRIKPTVVISDCNGDNNTTFKNSWGRTVYTRCEYADGNIYSTQHNHDLVFEMRSGLFRPVSIGRNYKTVIKNGRQVLVNKSAQVFWKGNFLKEDKSDKELAAEVLLRIHGNGDTRKERLGTRFNDVQKQVSVLAGNREELLWILAGCVLKGYFGTGDTRKKILNVGDGEMYYDDVQEKVKLTIKGADEVIADKYGKGDERIEKLKKAGYDPVVVQDYVTLLLT